MPSGLLCPALQHQYPGTVDNADDVYCYCFENKQNILIAICKLYSVDPQSRYYLRFSVQKSFSFFAVMPFNHRRTYKAELSEGSDQEKASYILTTKQKVVKLIGQWVALYGLLLKEDPIAVDFLEVRLQVLCVALEDYIY